MSGLDTTEATRPDTPTPPPPPEAPEPVGEPKEAPEPDRVDSPTRRRPDDTAEPEEPEDQESDPESADDTEPDGPEGVDEPLEPEASAERDEDADTGAADARPDEEAEPAEPESPEADADADAEQPEEPEHSDTGAEPADEADPDEPEGQEPPEPLENAEGTEAEEEPDDSIDQDDTEEHGDSETPEEPTEPRDSTQEEDSPEPTDAEASEASAEDEDPETPEPSGAPESPEDQDDELPELELELKPYRDSVPYSVPYTASLGTERQSEAPKNVSDLPHTGRKAEAPDVSAESAEPENSDAEFDASAELDPELADEPGELEDPTTPPDSLADVNEGREEAEHPEGSDASDGHADGPSGDIPTQALPREFKSNAEGAEYGREHWKEAQEQLTPEQREALQGYTDEKYPGDMGAPDYKEINGSLRGYVEGNPEIDESIARIDEAMELQPTPENVMVLRETGLNAFNCPVDELRGSIQSDPGYLSTALGPEATFDPGAEAVIHLEVPEGTPAMYLEGLSHYDTERELLLGRGLEYEVIEEPDYHGGRWHIYGRVLHQGEETGE
ncbi:ADP-ribosyltransferase [Streptomyces sp. NPDC001272]|uniref:ADP-ribosyltransferase n=1 Tax=Streptomyces sp. NPDC001674 TaxID=3154394 RepID=UPI003326050D